jgi:hypothetical protein
MSDLLREIISLLWNDPNTQDLVITGIVGVAGVWLVGKGGQTAYRVLRAIYLGIGEVLSEKPTAIGQQALTALEGIDAYYDPKDKEIRTHGCTVKKKTINQILLFVGGCDVTSHLSSTDCRRLLEKYKAIEKAVTKAQDKHRKDQIIANMTTPQLKAQSVPAFDPGLSIVIPTNGLPVEPVSLAHPPKFRK